MSYLFLRLLRSLYSLIYRSIAAAAECLLEEAEVQLLLKGDRYNEFALLLRGHYWYA